jgi:hypothetical protein
MSFYDRNCQTVINIWSWALDWAWHHDWLMTDRQSQCDFDSEHVLLWACVEAWWSISTVALRVVGGDENVSFESETVKYGRESHGTRTREWLRWRGPAAIVNNSQSASLSWTKAPIWGLRSNFYNCQTVAGLLMWGSLSDERTSLSFARARVSSNKSVVSM